MPEKIFWIKDISINKIMHGRNIYGNGMFKLMAHSFCYIISPVGMKVALNLITRVTIIETTVIIFLLHYFLN